MFLKVAVGAVGVVALEGCTQTRTTPGPARKKNDSGGSDGGSTGQRGMALRLAGNDIGPVEPFNYFPPAYTMLTFVYDTLLWPDATGKLVPWLASSHEESADGGTHTFRLREGVKWHDGQPFTAEDVVFTFDYFKQQEGKLPVWVFAKPENVHGVRAIDNHTVEFTLEKPAVTFARRVAATIPIVPRHIWSSIPVAQSGGELVGTGPYRFGSYGGRGKGGYLFNANEDFFLGRPFVGQIQMPPVGDELVALWAGKIDAAVMSLPTSSEVRTLDKFRRDPTFGILRGPADLAVCLHWNQRQGGVLADPRFRKACAYGIDRARLLKSNLGGHGLTGNPGFLPKGHPFHVDVEQYSYDVAAANRMLDSAGYKRRPDGRRLDPSGKALNFTVESYGPFMDAGQQLVPALNVLGIKLRLRAAPPINTDYSIAMRQANVSGDPDIMRQIYSSKSQDIFSGVQGYKNEEMDELAERQLFTKDSIERKRLIARMQQIAAKDLPTLPLYYAIPALIYKKSTFDQWTYKRNATPGGSPINKQVLVTGRADG